MVPATEVTVSVVRLLVTYQLVVVAPDAIVVVVLVLLPAAVCRSAVGDVVPMPTLPALVMRMRSVSVPPAFELKMSATVLLSVKLDLSASNSVVEPFVKKPSAPEWPARMVVFALLVKRELSYNDQFVVELVPLKFSAALVPHVILPAEDMASVVT